jgi:hypothetical protein
MSKFIKEVQKCNKQIEESLNALKAIHKKINKLRKPAQVFG